MESKENYYSNLSVYYLKWMNFAGNVSGIRYKRKEMAELNQIIIQIKLRRGKDDLYIYIFLDPTNDRASINNSIEPTDIYAKTKFSLLEKRYYKEFRTLHENIVEFTNKIPYFDEKPLKQAVIKLSYNNGNIDQSKKYFLKNVLKPAYKLTPLIISAFINENGL